MIIVDSLAAAAKINSAWRAAMTDIEADPLCLALSADWASAALREALRRDLALPRLQWAYATTRAMLASYAAVHAGGNLAPAGLLVHDGLLIAEHVLGHIAEELGAPFADRSYGILMYDMVSPEGLVIQPALLQAEDSLASRVYAGQPAPNIRLPGDEG